uniref:SXP/RAL-2 family protein Ani s 5-like cation-binding domain-containing protein n=1 Tax=Plectus sambesii TaxID=2011161 RepID=A0A914WYE4_9BILA
MVSLSFAAVVCSVLFVTASALRWDNRNGPGGRRDTESGEDGSGELDQREAGPMGGKSAWGGKRGLGRGHRGGLTFLANATEEERVEFLAIFKNRTLDKASKEAAIDALMATLDPAVQEAYNTWKAEKEAALAEKIAALSPEAKAAYDARELIENDATLSTQEKWTKLREFDRSQTDAVRMELRGLRWGGGKGGFRGNRWHGSGEKQFGRKPHGFSFLA